MNHFMFCIHCGNKIQTSDKFCGSCGNKVENSEENKETVVKEKSPTDILLEKYLSIARAEGEEDLKNRALLSPAIWEMFDRFTLNIFKSLLEEFLDDFNKQPYRVIEAIKEHMRFFVTSATQIWMAQRILKGEIIEPYQVSPTDVLADEWEQIFLKFHNNTLTLSPEVHNALTIIHERLYQTLFEKHPSLKDLPNAAADRLSHTLAQQLVSGYLLGLAEDSLRAQNKR